LSASTDQKAKLHYTITDGGSGTGAGNVAYGDLAALNLSLRAFFLAIRSSFSFRAAASAAAFSSMATCLAFAATSS